jgi:plasmid maintenance system antidote protein VapI
LTGNKKELKQKTAELIIAFVDILNNQKDTWINFQFNIYKYYKIVIKIL